LRPFFNEMEIKDRILTESLGMFFRQGIRRVTMDDIANHLAVSKKTIYSCFKDKDEIVQKACESFLNENRCMLKEYSQESKDAIHEIIISMQKLHETFSNLNPVLFDDMQRYYPKTWKLFLKFKEESIAATIEKNLKKGIAEQLYRPDINLKILVRLRLEEVAMGMNAEVFPPSQFKIHEVQLALLDHFLHGIVTVKGHRLINKYKNITDED